MELLKTKKKLLKVESVSYWLYQIRIKLPQFVTWLAFFFILSLWVAGDFAIQYLFNDCCFALTKPVLSCLWKRNHFISLDCRITCVCVNFITSCISLYLLPEIQLPLWSLEMIWGSNLNRCLRFHLFCNITPCFVLNPPLHRWLHWLPKVCFDLCHRFFRPWSKKIYSFKCNEELLLIALKGVSLELISAASGNWTISGTTCM